MNQSNPAPRRHRTFMEWCRRYISLSLVAVTGALVYIMFFTEKSTGETYRYTRKVEELKVRLRQEQDSLEYYRHLNDNVYTSPRAMEQVAREHFHMQHPNEDVYVAVE